MRYQSLVLVVASCAGLAMGGCGGSPTELEEHTGDLEATRIAFDLVERARSAEIVHDARFVDVGSVGAEDAQISGWSGPETDEETGSSFAWAVADRAVIETTVLANEPSSLEFRGRPFHFEGAGEQRVRVVVNGREIGDTVLKPGFRDYSIPLPKDAVEIGRNRIEFGFSRVASPADHLPGATDQRSLAAAFQWVSLGPPDHSEPEDRADPAAKSGELVIPPGTGLRYRLPVPSDAVLDFGLTVNPSTAADLRGRIWVAKPGAPAASSMILDPSALTGDRIRITLPTRSDQVLELGLATTGTGPSPASLVFHSPRILGETDQAEEIANVLLIVIDTLRADFVGVYGADVDTPNMDDLAERGVRFAMARSHIPITGPSHASLFTGLLPMEHGVRNNAQKLGEDLPTLAESLRSSGRKTAAVISLGVLQRQFGFDRGFEIFGDGFPRDWLKDAAEVTEEALGIAETALSEPYFLWVHYSDPHEPYAPSNEDYPRYELRLNGEAVGEIDAGGRGFRVDLDLPSGNSVLEFLPLTEGEPGRVYRVDNILIDDASIEVEALDGWHVIPRRMGRTTYESEFPASVRLINPGPPVRTGALVSCKKLLSKPEIRQAYAGETEFVDRQIGRLLAGLEERGLMENTLVVLASDHGEGLGNHNHVGHISQLYDSLLHVPLIFAWKGRLPEGLVVDDAVGLVDVFPTLVDLLGLDSPTTSSGTSLLPLLRREPMPLRPFIAATYRPESFSDKQAMVVDGLKFIHSWKDDREWEELYDVYVDPGELEDLAQSRREELDRLRGMLLQQLAEISEGSSVEAELSDEEKAHLRALGYLH